MNAHKETGLPVHDPRKCTGDNCDATEPHELFWVQFSDDGTAIRKWQRSPFEGGRKCRVAMTVTTDGENLVARLQSGGRASLGPGAHALNPAPSIDCDLTFAIQDCGCCGTPVAVHAVSPSECFCSAECANKGGSA